MMLYDAERDLIALAKFLVTDGHNWIF